MVWPGGVGFRSPPSPSWLSKPLVFFDLCVFKISRMKWGTLSTPHPTHPMPEHAGAGVGGTPRGRSSTGEGQLSHFHAVKSNCSPGRQVAGQAAHLSLFFFETSPFTPNAMHGQPIPHPKQEDSLLKKANMYVHPEVSTGIVFQLNFFGQQRQTKSRGALQMHKVFVPSDPPTHPAMGYRCVRMTGTVRHRAVVHSKRQREMLFSDKLKAASFAREKKLGAKHYCWRQMASACRWLCKKVAQGDWPCHAIETERLGCG